MPHRPTIAFDLDGTLVDSAPDLLAALNFVLGEIDLAPVDDAQVRNLVGGGARLMIEHGLALRGARRSEAQVDAMFADFLRFYEKHIADRSRPFPGAAEMLETLAADGTRLVVVTNKTERYAVQLLDVLGLAPHFAVIAGPDTFGVRKPDPEHLMRAVDEAGGSRPRAVMVGDSITDIITARAARVPVIAVSFGYHEGSVETLGADHVVDRLAEIPATLARIAAAGGRN